MIMCLRPINASAGAIFRKFFMSGLTYIHIYLADTRFKSSILQSPRCKAYVIPNHHSDFFFFIPIRHPPFANSALTLPPSYRSHVAVPRCSTDAQGAPVRDHHHLWRFVRRKVAKRRMTWFTRQNKRTSNVRPPNTPLAVRFRDPLKLSSRKVDPNLGLPIRKNCCSKCAHT